MTSQSFWGPHPEDTSPGLGGQAYCGQRWAPQYKRDVDILERVLTLESLQSLIHRTYHLSRLPRDEIHERFLTRASFPAGILNEAFGDGSLRRSSSQRRVFGGPNASQAGWAGHSFLTKPHTFGPN